MSRTTKSWVVLLRPECFFRDLPRLVWCVWIPSSESDNVVNSYLPWYGVYGSHHRSLTMWWTLTPPGMVCMDPIIGVWQCGELLPCLVWCVWIPSSESDNVVHSCRHASRWRTSSANIASVAAPVDGMADGGGIRDCSSDVSLSHTWPRGVVMACKAGVVSCLVGVSDEAAYGMGPVGAGGGPPVLERAKAAVGGMAGGGLAYVVWGSQQHAFLVGAADGLVCASWC